jgi:hypothetical protein
MIATDPRFMNGIHEAPEYLLRYWERQADFQQRDHKQRPTPD